MYADIKDIRPGAAHCKQPKAVCHSSCTIFIKLVRSDRTTTSAFASAPNRTITGVFVSHSSSVSVAMREYEKIKSPQAHRNQPI
jgi:hypothetical protein